MKTGRHQRQRQGAARCTNWPIELGRCSGPGTIHTRREKTGRATNRNTGEGVRAWQRRATIHPHPTRRKSGSWLRPPSSRARPIATRANDAGRVSPPGCVWRSPPTRPSRRPHPTSSCRTCPKAASRFGPSANSPSTRRCSSVNSPGTETANGWPPRFATARWGFAATSSGRSLRTRPRGKENPPQEP